MAMIRIRSNAFSRKHPPKSRSCAAPRLSEHGFLTHATNLTKQRRDVDDKAPLAKALVEEQSPAAASSLWIS